MPTESINTDLLLIVTGALPLLLTIAYFDRYLARLRRFASNAEYLERIQAQRGNSALHQFGHSYREDRRISGTDFVNLNFEPQIELSAPGFFSRRRILCDRFGRAVATHYEEYVMADRLTDESIPTAARPLLRLAEKTI